MHGPVFGEFMGTMVLVVLGDGVVANVLLKKSKGENSGWIVIATAWGLAVVAGICTAVACGSPGAHINPAITLAVAILSNKWANVGPFWMAQILGGFTGAILVWLVYLPHWKETPDTSAKLGIFCTIPAIRKLPTNFLCEMIVTIFLVVIGFSFGSKELAPAGLAPGFSPWFWGVLVWVLGLSLGGPTGYAINPARDLGPRLAHAVLPISGKGRSDWGYALIPVVAPLVGGALAAGIVKIAGIS
ncbi:MAG TPA: MIP/aquaporin family protein [Terriglobales bacterium]|nr:MIP/aquaporin family protein [Terriglobales bacterium]